MASVLYLLHLPHPVNSLMPILSPYAVRLGGGGEDAILDHPYIAVVRIEYQIS